MRKKDTTERKKNAKNSYIWLLTKTNMTETSILLIRAAREEYPAVQDNKFSVIVRLYHKYAPERYAIEYWPKDLILTGHQVKEDKTIAYFFELLHPPAQQDGTND